MYKNAKTINHYTLAANLDAILYQGSCKLFTNNKVTFRAFLCLEQLEFDAII